MELPTSRELELESLLRQRDNQLSKLNDEVSQLRQYLVSQPGPSTADPLTLPPALVSILLPHLHASSAGTGATGSSTVTAALTQRVRILQEENDELYDILKQGETGKLKEEVRSLRRIVERLEGALRESHHVITSLSTELDKSYESFAAATKLNNNVSSTKSISRSPRSSYHPNPYPSSTGNGTTTGGKPPPTGPRAHKKPRLSEAQTSPPPRSNAPLPPHKPHGHSHSSSRGADAREYAPRRSIDGRGRSNHIKMEVEEDQRGRPPSPMHERERERERERDGERERERGSRDRNRERERDRDRDRDGGRVPRRNGNFSSNSGRGGPGRRTERVLAPNDSFPGGDRTLAERMGL